MQEIPWKLGSYKKDKILNINDSFNLFQSQLI